MIQNDILCGGRVVGQAETERKGLYYQFCCMCTLPEETAYRILVRCGEKEADLGICIPLQKGFGLRTRLPVKQLGEGELKFRLCKKNGDTVFVPILPDRAFGCLALVSGQTLVRRGDQVGICVSPESVPQDSDQNP